jgi:hypothetical protein
MTWDRRIVPPIFVWMPESGATDIALDVMSCHVTRTGELRRPIAGLA